MSQETNKTIVQRFFTEVCNERRLDVADELFAAGHAYHDPSIPGVPPGPIGIKGVITKYQQGIPDAHWAVEEQIAEGDKVVARWVGTGTQSGTLNGIPPTGRKVNVPGAWTFRLANGKIVESWNVWDMFGMLQSLGVIPPAP